jgi:hypothetical protein
MVFRVCHYLFTRKGNFYVSLGAWLLYAFVEMLDCAAAMCLNGKDKQEMQDVDRLDKLHTLTQCELERH